MWIWSLFGDDSEGAMRRGRWLQWKVMIGLRFWVGRYKPEDCCSRWSPGKIIGFLILIILMVNNCG